MIVKIWNELVWFRKDLKTWNGLSWLSTQFNGGRLSTRRWTFQVH